MRKLVASALRSDGQRRRRHPAAAGPAAAGPAAAAADRHRHRPSRRRPVRRISPAFHRRPGAAGRRDGVPQRLPEPCRRPRPARAIRPSSPARTRRAAGSSPIAGIDYSAARADKAIYCAEDERVPGSTSSNLHCVAGSPERADARRLCSRRARPQSLSVSVAGKDRAAMLLGGQVRRPALVLEGGASSPRDLRGARTPAAVARTNAAVAAMIAAPQLPLVASPHCAAKSRVFQVPGGREVGNGRFARDAGDAAAFRSSPAFDGATLALVGGADRRVEAGLGHCARTSCRSAFRRSTTVGHDLRPRRAGDVPASAIASTATSAISSASSTRGASIMRSRLTADHGGLDIPERLRAQGVAGAALGRSGARRRSGRHSASRPSSSSTARC